MRYRLKPYDEVTDHSGLSRDKWESLEGKDLYVLHLTSRLVMIRTDGDCFPVAVNANDLVEIEDTPKEETPMNIKNNEVNTKIDKSLIRNLCSDVMAELAKDCTDLHKVVIVAEAFGLLLNKIPENN